MEILFHDDFDGIASAAMLSTHLLERGTEVQQLTPVDYNYITEDNWACVTPTSTRGPFAIVDFQFHPAATIFIDHHPTAFLGHKSWRATHETRNALGYLSYWNETAPSCAQVIEDNLELDVGFGDLVAAANTIDQAAYPSVESYFDPSQPASAMCQAYHLLTTGEKTELAQRFATGSLLSGYRFMNKHIDQAFSQTKQHLARYGEFISPRLDTAVLITDLTKKNAPPFIRYAAFSFYPQALYSLTVFAGSNEGDVRVNLSRNPWIEFKHQDLGAKVLSIGGGGHSYAAGVTFYGSNKQICPSVEAWRLLRRTLEELDDGTIETVRGVLS